jgi:hypothetical protein
MDEAALLAGDGDFTPLLNALSNEGMFVTLLHPPRASKDLLAAADARDPITVTRIYNWLDEASKAQFGPFPTPSYGSDANNSNCEHVWSSGDERQVEVWRDLSEEQLWVSWFDAERGDRLRLIGSHWVNTRLLESDDFGIELPELLPELPHL